MQKLPIWVLANARPSLYDVENATLPQMTARVYGAMNELIEEYNSFVEQSNANIEKYGAEMIKGQNEFTTKLIKTNREFFDCIRTYMEQNLPEQVLAAPEIESLFKADSGFISKEKSIETKTTESIYTKEIPAGESHDFYISNFKNMKMFSVYLDFENADSQYLGRYEMENISSNGVWVSIEAQTAAVTFRIYATVSDDIGSGIMSCEVAQYLSCDGNLHDRLLKAEEKILEQLIAINKLNQSVYLTPQNIYQGEIVNGGYYDATGWVENAKYKIAFLPAGAVQSGDKISFSSGFDYYNGSNRFDMYTASGSFVQNIYLGQELTFTIPESTIDNFKIGMRIRATQNENNLIITKSATAAEIDKVKKAYFGQLNEKTINCLGDSFTSPSYAWHYSIAERTGCIINNYGLASSRVSIDITKTIDGQQTTIKSFLNRVAEMDANADLTIIFGGINDAQTLTSGGITLGDIDSALNSTTFYGSLKKLITDIQNRMPGKKIIGVVPPDYVPYPTSSDYYLTMPQIQKACRDVFEFYSIPYADLKKDCQEMFVNEYNDATYRKVTASNANYHPSSAGHKAISEIIQSKIESVLRS